MATQLTDLPPDALVLCASRLDLRDLSSLAMSCRALRQIAYADPVWERQCRLRWPAKRTPSGLFQFTGGRDDYLGRLVASQQFRFQDPVHMSFSSTSDMRHIVLLENAVLATHCPAILYIQPDRTPLAANFLSGHTATITGMRLFPVSGFRNQFSGGNILVTCSADRTLRIWVQDRSVKTFRGHTNEVNVIADKLLGQTPVIASGGKDNTVRLWTLTGRRTPLLATLYGHETYIKDLAVAGHNPSLLISGAKDSKLRIWDTSAGVCVGNAKATALLSSVKTHQSICYASGGSSVAAIDLRTLKTVVTIKHPGGICATAISPFGKFLCTGGRDRTCKLWDIRSNHQTLLEVCGHDGPVDIVHLDNVKLVTASSNDRTVNVWDPSVGTLVSSFEHASPTSAIASRGTKLVIASASSGLHYQDFSNCTEPSAAVAEPESSKFWDM